MTLEQFLEELGDHLGNRSKPVFTYRRPAVDDSQLIVRWVMLLNPKPTLHVWQWQYGLFAPQLNETTTACFDATTQAVVALCAERGIPLYISEKP